MRCTVRACLPLRALCLSRLDLCPLLALSHSGSAHSRKPVRRGLRLEGNRLAALPATVFNGLTSLEYVASSPSTHTHARAYACTHSALNGGSVFASPFLCFLHVLVWGSLIRHEYSYGARISVVCVYAVWMCASATVCLCLCRCVSGCFCVQSAYRTAHDTMQIHVRTHIHLQACT